MFPDEWLPMKAICAKFIASPKAAVESLSATCNDIVIIA